MKRYILLIAFIHYVCVLFSQHVSEADALRKAQAFMQEKVAVTTDGKHRAPRKIGQLSKAIENDAYYVFNAEDNGGFVIVSGDERTDEILGYSTEGNIDFDKMPENMKAWLKGYEEQILAIPANVKAVPAKVPTHPAVEPLITSKWGQGAPYNLQCPEIDGERCLTGCVATALAQIMFYHKWPEDYTSTIPGYSSYDDLPPIKFDWKNMKDKYGEFPSDVSAQAVANLMRYCGQAVEMNYGVSASSASESTDALIDYFGYDKNARRFQAEDFSIAQWDSIIYNEMAKGRPVWYGAHQKAGIGHSFVLDGYDGDGLFHINWGWSGYCDGFYKITNMAPYSEGSDAGTVLGYTLLQHALIGIQKPGTVVEQEQLGIQASVSAFLETNGYSILKFVNYTGENVVVDIGLSIEGINGTPYSLMDTIEEEKVIKSGMGDNI